MVIVGKQREEDVAEPALEKLIKEDRTPWYKKPNLRSLYLILFPACMGIEITSGFDSQIINVVQIVYTWNKCSPSPLHLLISFRLANLWQFLAKTLAS